MVSFFCLRLSKSYYRELLFKKFMENQTQQAFHEIKSVVFKNSVEALLLSIEAKAGNRPGEASAGKSNCEWWLKQKLNIFFMFRYFRRYLGFERSAGRSCGASLGRS